MSLGYLTGLKKEKQISFRVDPAFAAEIEQWSAQEDLSVADFVRKLLKLASVAYREAGSLHSLRAGSAAVPRKLPSSSRVSEETMSQLYTALESLLQHAPSAVVERVVEFLISNAGKYNNSL